MDGFLIVANDLVDFVGEEVAHGALDEVGLLEDAGGRGLVLHLLPRSCAIAREQAEIADEIARTLAFADGADDDAHALRDVELLENLAKPLALLGVFDLPRDAALVADTA